jgi:hypothetical protein
VPRHNPGDNLGGGGNVLSLTHEEETHAIHEMLISLCEKLGVTKKPERSVKDIDAWAQDTVIRLQKRKDGK